MKNKFVLLSSLIIVHSAHAQTVLNGSFENTDGSFTGYDIMLNGLAPGWSTGSIANNHSSPDWVYAHPTSSLKANPTDGSYFQSFDSYADGAYTSVKQTVSGFTGGAYKLSFDHANLVVQFPDNLQKTIGGFRVLLDGIQIGSFTSTNTIIRQYGTDQIMANSDWKSSSLQISPTAGAHEVELAAFYTSGSNHGKLYTTQLLDNVTLTAVPEPSSTTLLGLSTITLLLRRRK